MDIASSETIDDNFFKRKFSLIYNCLNRVFFLETQRWKKCQAWQSYRAGKLIERQQRLY